MAAPLAAGAPLLPSHLWCHATPRYRTEAEAAAVRRRLAGWPTDYRHATCCSLDKVDSVLQYAGVVLDFKWKTMDEQRGFADTVRRSLDRATSGSPCQGLLAGALRRRAEVLEASLGLLQRGLRLVRRLARSTLRAHCLLPRGPHVARLEHRGHTRGAAALAGLLAALEALATTLVQGDASTMAEAEGGDGALRRCLPLPFSAALAGVPAPRPAPVQPHWDVRYPFFRPVGTVRTWLVWVDRFSLALPRLTAKVAYQLKVLTASFEPTFQTGPLATLFWTGELLVGEEDTWRWPNHQPAPTPPPANGSLAIVVLVSNLTDDAAIDGLWTDATRLAEASEGLEILWLEDSLREPWVTSVRPVHARDLIERSLSWRAPFLDDASKLRVLWRRHQATLSCVEVASLHLAGAPSRHGVILWDARRSSALTEPGLARACRREATHVLSAAEAHSGLRFIPQADLDAVAARINAQSSSAWSLQRLDKYLAFHRETVHSWKGLGANTGQQARALVYMCNPFSLCGGHGDRTNGILSTFVLAILTGRAFFIDLDSPMPLNMLLQPRRAGNNTFLLDWRLTGGAAGSGGQLFYLDDRVAFQEDLAWLVEDPSPLLLVSMNHRELQVLLEHPLLVRRAEELGFRAWPDLAARLWDVLFEPTPILRQRLEAAQEELGLPGQLPWQPLSADQDARGDYPAFIAIHFRAGNESARLWWDPERHALSSLPQFLECAQQAEEELGLGSSTRWFLSADTEAALALEPVQRLRASGKLVALGDGWGLAHVDRSHVSHGLRGFADSYVAYLLIASARAVVLSRSYFGETAAEIGAVPDAFFAEGCVRTDLRAS